MNSLKSQEWEKKGIEMKKQSSSSGALHSFNSNLRSNLLQSQQMQYIFLIKVRFHIINPQGETHSTTLCEKNI